MTADALPQTSLVHTDARGRVYLGKHLQPNRTYRVTKHDQGMVVFEPVTAYTEEELAVLKEKKS